jgi:ligand-binding sensor domain-containing protein
VFPEDAAAWRLYTEEDGLERGWWPRILQTRNTTLWTVSDNGAYGVNRFDGKTWTNFRLRDLGGSDWNTSLLETADGILWIGSSDILHAFRNGTWRMYRSQEVSTSFYHDQLLETSDGALWVASLEREAFRLDLGPSQWTSWEGLHFQGETPDGALWFVSQDRGVVRYDGRVRSTGSEQAWTR